MSSVRSSLVKKIDRGDYMILYEPYVRPRPRTINTFVCGFLESLQNTKLRSLKHIRVGASILFNKKSLAITAMCIHYAPNHAVCIGDPKAIAVLIKEFGIARLLLPDMPQYRTIPVTRRLCSEHRCYYYIHDTKDFLAVINNT